MRCRGRWTILRIKRDWSGRNERPSNYPAGRIVSLNHCIAKRKLNNKVQRLLRILAGFVYNNDNIARSSLESLAKKLKCRSIPGSLWIVFCGTFVTVIIKSAWFSNRVLNFLLMGNQRPADNLRINKHRMDEFRPSFLNVDSNGRTDQWFLRRIYHLSYVASHHSVNKYSICRLTDLKSSSAHDAIAAYNLDDSRNRNFVSLNQP